MPRAGEPLGTIGHWITTRLATGGALLEPASIATLSLGGITALINTQAERDDSALVDGFVYVWNGVADDGLAKPVSWFETSIQFGLSVLARPGQRVYVYCGAGSNRGPSTAYAILLAMGLEQNLALDLILAGRPGAQVAYRGDAERAVVELGYA
jgi:hypothetical protein